MEPTSLKLSPLDFIAVIVKGNFSNGQLEGVAMLLENRNLVMVVTTSIALLIGFVVVLAWRRATGSARNKQLQPPKLVVPKAAAELEEVDDDISPKFLFFSGHKLALLKVLLRHLLRKLKLDINRPRMILLVTMMSMRRS